MTSRPGMRKLFGATLTAAMASLWLAGCMAGTATDTENGIQVTAQVVGANGAPMAQVEVKVQSLYSGPESKSDDPLMPGTATLRTDSAGFVTFTVKRAGHYMAQGQRGDTVLLIDTLRASAKDTLVLRAAGVQRLRGKVRLYSGYQIDTGFVFLRGSTIAVPISRTGDYDFGYVPLSADSLTLGAHYSAKPASRVFVKMADAAGGALVIDSRFSVDPDLAPVSGANLTLLKASGSATNVCLENGQQALELGVSIRGSLVKAADVMRAAQFACSNRVGAAIQVDSSTLAGASLKKLGDYVQGDAAIWPTESKHGYGLGSGSNNGQKTVVPANCLQAGSTTNFTTTVNQGANGADIRVDDISLQSGCEY